MTSRQKNCNFKTFRPIRRFQGEQLPCHSVGFARTRSRSSKRRLAPVAYPIERKSGCSGAAVKLTKLEPPGQPTVENKSLRKLALTGFSVSFSSFAIFLCKNAQNYCWLIVIVGNLVRGRVDIGTKTFQSSLIVLLEPIV
jgi:hypothetical protein